MFRSNQGFTLTELIVVIVILSVLSTVGFIRYTGYQSTSRDSTRKADLASLQIALKGHERARGSYPTPSGSQSYAYNGTTVAMAGKMDDSIDLEKIDTIPVDPITQAGYYYSVSGRKNSHLLAATLEIQNIDPIAYVVTDYRPSIVDALPTIGFATGSYGDVASLRSTFLFDGSSKNLPYSVDKDALDFGLPVQGALSYNDLANESGVKLPKKALHDSCSDLALQRAYIGTGVYYISDASGNETQTTCNASNITQ